MPLPDPPEIRPGTTLTGRLMQRIVEAIPALARSGAGTRVKTAGRNSVIDAGSPTARPAVPFWARIVADTLNAAAHAWQEIAPDASTPGSWLVKPGGRSGTTTTNPAYEANGLENVAADTVVIMIRTHTATAGRVFRFIAPIAAPVRMRVKTIENDYLVCRTWDGTTEGTTDIPVAKPPDLRHATTWYPGLGLTSWSTTSAQEADATAGAVTETWAVNIPYGTNTEIKAVQPIGGTGLVSAPDWEDTNNAGKKWGVVEA